MAQPNSKQTLIDYAFRTLGAPVVEINVDHQQALDRLDDALQFFSERHYDGVERAYFSYVLTQQDIANKQLEIARVNKNKYDKPQPKNKK